jgi:hypothetical protein
MSQCFRAASTSQIASCLALPVKNVNSSTRVENLLLGPSWLLDRRQWLVQGGWGVLRWCISVNVQAVVMVIK